MAGSIPPEGQEAIRRQRQQAIRRRLLKKLEVELDRDEHFEFVTMDMLLDRVKLVLEAYALDSPTVKIRLIELSSIALCMSHQLPVARPGGPLWRERKGAAK
jgi:hypothetical protein